MRSLVIILVTALAACTQPAGTAPDASPVIAAERAFARAASQGGWVEAFEVYSADDALIIAAQPINAHQSLAGIDPANRGDRSLTWAPEFAGISRGGDIGFTTGPYNGGGAAFGQYFTVWRRQADGAWKWIYDGGTNQTAPTTVDMEAEVAVVPVARGAGSAAAAVDAVRAREAALAERAAVNAGEAFGAVFAEAGRMNRDNQPTALGADAAALLVGAGGVRYTPPSVIEAGAAGDLVFTLGEARWEGGSGYYCRVWVLQGDGWKIAYDQIIERALAELDAVQEDPPPP